MSKPTRWQDLKIGILSTLGVVVVALGVLIFGRVGTLHGKTFTLYVTTGEARGVIRGTEVWLDGQKVGLVRGIGFQPPSTVPRDRLVITLKVLSSAKEHIRLDTRVQVRAGTSVIGDQVVYLSSGTAKMREVAAGDTIHATRQVDFESESSRAAEASKEFPEIIDNVKLLTAQLKSVNSTLGALGVDQGDSRIEQVKLRASRLMTRLSSGDGTIPMAMSNSDLLTARAKRTMAQVDSIRALVGSGDHSLGRFRRDSTLVGSVTRVRNELSALQQQALSPNGSIGRFRTDSAIVMNIHRDLVALDSLIADMKKHPLRYNPF